ncbi:MAG: ComEA family DNA-binding protein [Patescibacteria group bacterium]|nr:ComEA family DNA-binding protein [Patescibacteria group bacterium]
MDFRKLLDEHPFFKNNFLAIILGIFGLIFLIYGFIVIIGSSKSSDNLVLEKAKENQTDSKKEEPGIFVDVEGAVIKPGVYKLPSDARIQDALVAASGLSSGANREWVSKNLNLAQKLKDGSKIYIPKTNENAPITVNNQSFGTSTENNQININTASVGELDTLPGVGPVTAQKIINGRPYNSVEELIVKKIVNQSTFEKIKDRITAY